MTQIALVVALFVLLIIPVLLVVLPAVGIKKIADRRKKQEAVMGRPRIILLPLKQRPKEVNGVKQCEGCKHLGRSGRVCLYTRGGVSVDEFTGRVRVNPFDFLWEARSDMGHCTPDARHWEPPIKDRLPSEVDMEVHGVVDRLMARMFGCGKFLKDEKEPNRDT